jgi:hypothetical protein
MPRFPYVVEVPKTRDMLSVSEGVIRAPDPDAAEAKIRQKFPKAQHIEIMAAIPLDEDHRSTWERIEPYLGVVLCFIIGAGLLVGAFIVSQPGEDAAPKPSEEAIDDGAQQQSDAPILEESEDFPEWNLYDLE